MKIKICGLFRDNDIDFVNEAKPDYAGFVFTKSARQISEAAAAKFRAKLHKNIISVGVFKNTTLDDIVRLYNKHIISIAQLHGEESDEYIYALKTRGVMTVIKALKIREGMGKKSLETESASYKNADFLLFDSSGGSGKTFDWDLLRTSDSRLAPPEMRRTPYFLAGGINCDNIDQAIKMKPFCIDVSSGVETDGLKDRDKIIKMVSSVRSAKPREL
ncbi:MAG: phosphoribosylanthranilate isomerase [Spirochaetaceae bacterium]|jgi:phosphoribosylanthranilate isomerase|nr:phosphoribosylanthranilate isomerase [Spirochaetaceae bacterium]